MTFFKKPLSRIELRKGGFYASGEGDGNACSPVSMFGVGEPAEACPLVQVTALAVTPSSDIAQ
jgi:hypothetical protein